MEFIGHIYDNQIQISNTIEMEQIDGIDKYLFENTIKTRSISRDNYDGHYFVHYKIIYSNNNNSSDYFCFKEKYSDLPFLGFMSVGPICNESLVEEIKNDRNEVSVYVYLDETRYNQIINLISKKKNNDIIALSFTVNQRFDPKIITEPITLPIVMFNLTIKSKEMSELDEKYEIFNIMKD